MYHRQGCEPTENFLSGGMLDDRQRNVRKCFQDPLCSWLVGDLLLVLWVHIGEAGLILRKRPPQDKLHDRQHADTERQQVRKALNVLVELDKQRGDMDPALEAVEDAFNAVFVATLLLGSGGF